MIIGRSLLFSGIFACSRDQPCPRFFDGFTTSLKLRSPSSVHPPFLLPSIESQFGLDASSSCHHHHHCRRRPSMGNDEERFCPWSRRWRWWPSMSRRAAPIPSVGCPLPTRYVSNVPGCTCKTAFRPFCCLWTATWNDLSLALSFSPSGAPVSPTCLQTMVARKYLVAGKNRGC